MKRYCNVTATVEIMVEIPEGEFITPKQFEKHIESQMWKHVSNIRVINERIEYEKKQRLTT